MTGSQQQQQEQGSPPTHPPTSQSIHGEEATIEMGEKKPLLPAGVPKDGTTTSEPPAPLLATSSTDLPPGRGEGNGVLSTVLGSTYFIIAILVLAAVVGVCPMPNWVLKGLVKPSSSSIKVLLMTPEELSMYDGMKRGAEGKLRLAVLGQVFDVSKGPQFYGPGKGYHGMVGRDASRSFITGDFKNDLTDNLEGITNEQLAGLVRWQEFYHKEYTFVGHVHGAFYDASQGGKATQELERVLAAAAFASSDSEQLKRQEAELPRCDTRWSDRDGGSVSCEGRDNLRPRLVYINPLREGGEPTTRCACMEGDGWSDVRRVYPGCAPDAQICHTSPPPSPPRGVQGQGQEVGEKEAVAAAA